MSQLEYEIFERVGEDGFARLIAAFYRQVRTDPILSPLYPDDDWEGAELRLRDFLVGRFGGPPRYVEARGHPRLRMRHMPFAIDQAARDRWVELMENALTETALPDKVDAFLRQFLGETATFLINRR